MAIAITGAIWETSLEKLQELKFCLFYQIFHKKLPSCPFKLIPSINNSYASWSAQNNPVSFLYTKSSFFKNSFFPAVLAKWNNLDVNIRNSTYCIVFKN